MTIQPATNDTGITVTAVIVSVSNPVFDNTNPVNFTATARIIDSSEPLIAFNGRPVISHIPCVVVMVDPIDGNRTIKEMKDEAFFKEGSVVTLTGVKVRTESTICIRGYEVRAAA